MSLFVADLAFATAPLTPLLTAAKLGILVASVIAGFGGWVVLSRRSSLLRH
jgi:Na+/H+ antiporter NhaA